MSKTGVPVGVASTPSAAERERLMAGEPPGFRARATAEDLGEI
ncbi:MAG TPA: hypothetical protein VM597_15045 [Gemmataceae bacterium]|jgi:hypothetical protein|nr:hypothetical protein [Gemmataceae bacterium]